MTDPAAPGARLAYVNLLCADFEAQSRFYAALFGFPEITAFRSPIYRCLDAGGLELGFNADAAYDLLGLSDRRPGGERTVRAYFTIELAAPETIDAIAVRAPALGGRVIKAPYLTYYNARQAVLEDPEGNIFRLNHRLGPRQPAADIADPPWQAR